MGFVVVWDDGEEVIGNALYYFTAVFFLLFSARFLLGDGIRDAKISRRRLQSPLRLGTAGKSYSQTESRSKIQNTTRVIRNRRERMSINWAMNQLALSYREQLCEDQEQGGGGSPRENLDAGVVDVVGSGGGGGIVSIMMSSRYRGEWLRTKKRRRKRESRK